MIYRGERVERGLTGEGEEEETLSKLLLPRYHLSIFLSFFLPYPAGLLLEVHLPEPGVEAGEGVEGEHQVEARADKCLGGRENGFNSQFLFSFYLRRKNSD